MEALQQIRRVVTGVTATGGGIVSDAAAPVLDFGDGSVVYEIWRAPHPLGAEAPGRPCLGKPRANPLPDGGYSDGWRFVGYAFTRAFVGSYNGARCSRAGTRSVAISSVYSASRK
jgi:hypothetical protein